MCAAARALTEVELCRHRAHRLLASLARVDRREAHHGEIVSHTGPAVRPCETRSLAPQACLAGPVVLATPRADHLKPDLVPRYVRPRHRGGQKVPFRVVRLALLEEGCVGTRVVLLLAHRGACQCGKHNETQASCRALGAAASDAGAHPPRFSSRPSRSHTSLPPADDQEPDKNTVFNQAGRQWEGGRRGFKPRVLGRRPFASSDVWGERAAAGPRRVAKGPWVNGSATLRCSSHAFLLQIAAQNSQGDPDGKAFRSP
jgi:hypothetical protein